MEATKESPKTILPRHSVQSDRCSQATYSGAAPKIESALEGRARPVRSEVRGTPRLRLVIGLA
jgi:hypothetical protein